MVENSVTFEHLLNTNKSNNTQRRNKVNEVRNDTSEQNYNAVLSSLRRFVLQKNNINNEYPITKTQVIKHHARAKRALSQDGMFLSDVLRSEKRKKFEMSLKSIKVSDTLKVTGANQSMYSGDKVKTLYSLKTLVDAINGTWTFPFAATDPPPSLALAHGSPVASQIVTSHQAGVFQLDFNNFRVKSDQGEVMIRYYPAAPFNNSTTAKYIEWTYIPDPEIAILLAHFTFGNFTVFDFKNQISIATNQKVSAALIGMLLGNVDSQQAARAMIDAKYPSRLWDSRRLKNVAQDPYVKSNNFGSNYAGSKLSRIESFLKTMDDLFVSVLKGEFRQEDVPKLIDEIASRPDMYALDAQKEVINKLRQPLRRESNQVNALLSNNTRFNNSDKRIVAVSKDAAELIALTVSASLQQNDLSVIRSTKGENIGVVLPDLGQPLNFSSPNTAWPTKGPFIPNVAKGSLARAVKFLLQYCLWNGTHNSLTKQNGTDGTFGEWIHTHLQAAQNPGINEIGIFKTCTTTKIEKLLKLIPKYFQKSLIEILKRELQVAIQNDNTQGTAKIHEWFSGIYDFRLVRY